MKWTHLNLIFVILFLFHYKLLAQASLIQDAKGESSIILANQSAAVFNFADASVNLAYLRAINTNQHYWGFNAKFKSLDGVSNVFKNGHISPNGQLGLFVVWQNFNAARTKHHDFYINGNLETSSFNLFDETKSYSNQISTQKFSGLNAKVGWNKLTFSNFLGSSAFPSSVIIGLSASAGVTNNLDQLTKVTLSDYKTVADTSNGSTRLIEQKQTTAFSLTTPYRDNIGYARINADIGIYPQIFKSRVVLILFTRSKFADKILPTHDAGTGLFLTKKGAPLDIIGGITYQFSDVFDVKGTDKTVVDRSLINIVAGFTF